jgi:hypothetical protein
MKGNGIEKMTAITLRRGRLRWAWTVAVAALLVLPGAVAAHHADVTASMDCDGLVSFTVTAWNGPTNASRTNPDIGVWVSKDGGAFVELTSPDYFFAASNGYTFSDTYDAGDASSVVVKVQAQANWANGTEPGDPRQATASAPSDCVQPTPTPTPTPTATNKPDPTPTPTPTPTATPPSEPTATPTPTTKPTGGVEAETGTPKTTLPPTATIDGSTDGGTGSGLPIVLIALLGIAVAVGLLSPSSNRSRRRSRRE